MDGATGSARKLKILNSSSGAARRNNSGVPTTMSDADGAKVQQDAPPTNALLHSGDADGEEPGSDSAEEFDSDDEEGASAAGSDCVASIADDVVDDNVAETSFDSEATDGSVVELYFTSVKDARKWFPPRTKLDLRPEDDNASVLDGSDKQVEAVLQMCNAFRAEWKVEPEGRKPKQWSEEERQLRWEEWQRDGKDAMLLYGYDEATGFDAEWYQVQQKMVWMIVDEVRKIHTEGYLLPKKQHHYVDKRITCSQRLDKINDNIRDLAQVRGNLMGITPTNLHFFAACPSELRKRKLNDFVMNQLRKSKGKEAKSASGEA